MWRESGFEVKIVKNRRLRGVFWRFKVCFVWQAQGFRHVAKFVAGAGVREDCKNVGRRRGGFEEGPKRCFSRGKRRDSVLCHVGV